MKKALCICLLLISTTAFAQINDGTYKINVVVSDQIGLEYRFTKIAQEASPGDRTTFESYGNHITFNSAAGTFHSYYSAPCGNDCFRSSSGRYSIVDESHIRLHLLETRRDGFCDGWKGDGEEIIPRDLDLGVFLIQTDDGGINLIPEQSKTQNQ